MSVKKGRKTQQVKGSEYNKIYEEMTVDKSLLLKGNKLVIPQILQARVIAAAHEGHWFTGLAEKCRQFVRTCHPGCTAALPDKRPAPMTNRDTPEGPEGPQTHSGHNGPDRVDGHRDTHHGPTRPD